MPAALLAQGPAQAKDIWAIRQQLSVGKKVRDLAMFNCALDAKLRAYAPARPKQAGEHRQVPRYRGGRCTGDVRADRFVVYDQPENGPGHRRLRVGSGHCKTPISKS